MALSSSNVQNGPVEHWITGWLSVIAQWWHVGHARTGRRSSGVTNSEATMAERDGAPGVTGGTDVED